jgi:hypothetical protein
MGKKSGSGSGMNKPDHISESLETTFWLKIFKFFDADPGWKKIGSEKNIPDPQHTGVAYLKKVSYNDLVSQLLCDKDKKF